MKKVLSVMLIFFMCLLVGCKTVEKGTTVRPSHSLGEPTTTVIPTPSNPVDDDKEVEFVITLMLRGEAYYDPEYSEENAIEVIFSNSTTEKRVILDENGVARTKGLVGEFNVHLSKTPSGYTYDPNKTVVSNANPVGEIELLRIVNLKESSLNDLFSKIIKINNITISDPEKKNVSYCYMATLKSPVDIKYYQFTIKNAGSYTIESLVDCYDNNINPIVSMYRTGPEALATYDKDIDDGGFSKPGGYTKNFKFQIDLDRNYIGNVSKFGIKADVKDASAYPITIPFKITYVDTYSLPQKESTMVMANDIYYKRDNSGNLILDEKGNPIMNYIPYTEENKYFSPSYGCVDNSGGLLHFPNKWNMMIDPNINDPKQTRYLRARYNLVNGEYVLNPEGQYILMETTKSVYGSNYQHFGDYSSWKQNGNIVLSAIQNGVEVIKYDPTDGYYHFNYNGEDRIVCVSITQANLFVESALNHIEDPGNGALQNVIIDKKIYDYKRFIEAEYTSVCSNGVCYLTKELKEFLQYFSNSQCYFFDGNGWCEQNNVFASQENQWLYACGFFRN